MRIGVLTYHCPPNFGAQLQAISTVGYLKRCGHEPVVIDWYDKELEEMYSHRIPECQTVCHQSFTKDNFPLSKRCGLEKELIEEINDLNLDCIVLGSDALFKYIPEKLGRYFSIRKLRFVKMSTHSYEKVEGNPFFGDFLSQLSNRIPASVYAASSQNCPYSLMSKKERLIMSKALLNFNTISVRDVWTKRMVEKVTGINDIKVYPDPVFSFNNNCYLPIPTKKEIMEKFHLNEKYVLFSFSGKYCNEPYIQSLADEVERHGFQPVALPMPEKLFAASIKKTIQLPLSPIEWYALIIHSCGYVGERMHPIVVCLHNVIPFFCFDEYGIIEKKWFKKKYNALSSKTFLVVKEAGLTGNLHSYKDNNNVPEVSDVIDKLLTFDKEKCKKFSQKKCIEYEEGMKEIIKTFYSR